MYAQYTVILIYIYIYIYIYTYIPRQSSHEASPAFP